jgi:O-antigen/teichoic acid export membrane protein
MRILIGLGRNSHAIAISMTATLFSLIATGILVAFGASGIIYASSAFIGSTVSNAFGLLWTFRVIRRSGHKIKLWTSPVKGYRNLLAGSGAFLIVTLGLPLGLESGRLILSHTSDPAALSEFALMAQLYAIGWSIASTSSGSMWTLFAQRRRDPKESYRLWKLTTAVLSAGGLLLGIALWLASPWVGLIISGGTIKISGITAFAFAVLLVCQCLHLPTGSMFTSPAQLRWQAGCVAAMAAISLIAGILLSRQIGASGIAFAAAAGVFVAQFIPDLVIVKRFFDLRVCRSEDVSLENAESRT